MKIMHMLPALTKGGGERVAVDLANAAAKAGHTVTVAAGWKVDETLLRTRLDPDVTVHYMLGHLTGVLRRYSAGLMWMWRNRSLLADQDVVHCHLTQAALLGTIIHLARAASRETRPAIVETYHSVGMPIPKWLTRFRAALCKRRDGLALMATDSYWSDYLRRHPNLPSKIIPNGVDAPLGRVDQNQVAQFLVDIKVPKVTRQIVGNVGRFRASRKPLLMVNILIELAKKTDADVHFLMCGDGPKLDEARALVEAANMGDRITLPGAVNDPRLAMSAMSLYLTINVREITGIAGLEAAFCGLPIVAWQTDQSYAVSPQDWIWSDHDPMAVCTKSLFFLSSPADLDALATAQHNHAVSHYGVAAMHSTYDALYSEAISHCGPARRSPTDPREDNTCH